MVFVVRFAQIFRNLLLARLRQNPKYGSSFFALQGEWLVAWLVGWIVEKEQRSLTYLINETVKRYLLPCSFRQKNQMPQPKHRAAVTCAINVVKIIEHEKGSDDLKTKRSKAIK